MEDFANSKILRINELINSKSIQRALEAFKIIPLNNFFYRRIEKKGLNAKEVFKTGDLYKVKHQKWFKNQEAVERAFRLLIKVGILRREVDGQGLTESVRITPLGKAILENIPAAPLEKANFMEKIKITVYLLRPF